MANAPLFQSTESSEVDSHERPPAADIIKKIDTALESMRDSGYDLTAAVGEPVDNSVEAEAHIIRVQPTYGPKNQSITAIAVADDGIGIAPDLMAHVLSMGYSTRYGLRGGLGRFGVGMKLAGLSLGRRIDVYSKRQNDNQIWHAYIDLNEIRNGSQTHIVAEKKVDDWPAASAELMTDPMGSNSFQEPW